jgi:hypothetical protein
MTISKLSEQEIQDLKEFQIKNNQIVMSLGQIAIQKVILENQKDELVNKLAELQETQTKLGKELQDKYGIGSINIETGEFTSEN